MPEIVEADMPQTFQFQQLAEIAAEIPGIKNVPHYIHEHIAVVFPVVAVAADPLVFLLLLLQGQQLLPDIVDQRKRAQTGFRLGAILADDLILAVYLGICYDVSDGDGIALKVDGVPSQAQSLAAPEPVERGDLDQQRIGVILCRLKELLQLLQTVVIRDILLLLRTLHLVGGVVRNEVHLDGIFQSLVNIGVLVDDRAGRHGFQLVQIEALNMPGLKLAQLDAGFPKVRCDLPLYHLRVRGKGGLFHRAADNLQPQLHVVGKQHIRGDVLVLLAHNRRNKALAGVQQQLLSAALVSLCRKSCGNPRLPALAVGIRVIQHHVVIVVFYLQVSCYHKLYLLCG